MSGRKRRCCQGIPRQTDILLVTEQHSSHVEMFLVYSSSRKACVQCGTFHGGTWMVFYHYRSLLHQLANIHCWHLKRRILTPLQGIQFTRPSEASGMSNVWWWHWPSYNLHKTVVIHLFSELILSMLPFPSEKVKWLFVTASCQYLLFQNLWFLARAGRIQSESVECSLAKARCSLS